MAIVETSTYTMSAQVGCLKSLYLHRNTIYLHAVQLWYN